LTSDRSSAASGGATIGGGKTAGGGVVVEVVDPPGSVVVVPEAPGTVVVRADVVTAKGGDAAATGVAAEPTTVPITATMSTAERFRREM
jgi:hypothetical protein